MIPTIAATMIYALGWVWAARYLLTRRMNSPAACRKGLSGGYCQDFHGPDCRRTIGETRPRTLTDALNAMIFAFAWPIVAVAAAVDRGTPLTPGEQTRVLAEQRHTIARQSADLRRLTEDIR